MYQEFHDNSVNNNDKRQGRKQKQNEKRNYAYPSTRLTFSQTLDKTTTTTTQNNVAVYASDACDLETKSSSSYRV